MEETESTDFQLGYMSAIDLYNRLIGNLTVENDRLTGRDQCNCRSGGK